MLVESATVKYISDQRRLPFEKVSRNVSAGAYGKIDKVGISPSYFINRDGWTFPEVHSIILCEAAANVMTGQIRGM